MAEDRWSPLYDDAQFFVGSRDAQVLVAQCEGHLLFRVVE